MFLAVECLLLVEMLLLQIVVKLPIGSFFAFTNQNVSLVSSMLLLLLVVLLVILLHFERLISWQKI